MKKNKIFMILISLLLIACISGCGNTDVYPNAAKTTSLSDAQASADISTTAVKTVFPITIKDSYDREVIIEKEPSRIVSLAPNITETIFALGQGQRLVGRTDYCDYPSEALKVASMGSLTQPSIEKIAQLKPDLVIASTHFSKDTLNKLEEIKIPTVVLYGEESFDGVYFTISNIGKILNSADKSETLINKMKEKVRYVKECVEGKDKPSVYYVIGYGKSGDFTAGKNTFINQMIEMAGAQNAAADAVNWTYSLEKLIQKNPDIIICQSNKGYKQGLQTTNGYKSLKAVTNDKLYEIDDNIISRQGPRIVDGLVEMAKIIHPEAIKE